MGKHVILTLKYDLGDYSDLKEEGVEIPTNPEDYAESFFQADVNILDM